MAPRPAGKFQDHAEEIESYRCERCGELDDSTRDVPVLGNRTKERLCHDCLPPTKQEISEIKAQEELDRRLGK